MPAKGQNLRSAIDPALLPSNRVSVLSIRLSMASIILAFFPYLAIPLSENTNMPWSTLVGLLALVLGPREIKTDGTLWLLALLPFTAHASSAILLGSGFPLSGQLTWVTVAASFGTGLIAVCALQSRLVPLIAYMIIGTGLYAVIQYFFILGGSLPFVEWYEMSGYASVPSNAATILQYIRRPFGQFPEPSFLAGSLLLALSAMSLASRTEGGRWGRLEKVAMALGFVVILLSRSGVAVAGLGLLSVLVIASVQRSLKAIAVGTFLLVLGVLGGLRVLDERGLAHNYSWDDRLNSILLSLQYWASDPLRFIFGVGRGGVARAFREGRIDLTGFSFTEAPQDVLSVLVRIAIESGVIAGGITLAVVTYQVARGGRELGWSAATATLLIWLLVAGLTISYESAAWLWVLPGICRGLWLSSAAKNAHRDPRRSRGSESSRFQERCGDVVG